MLQDCVSYGAQRHLMEIFDFLCHQDFYNHNVIIFTPFYGIEVQEIRFCDFKDFDIILCQFKKQSFHSTFMHILE